VSEKAGRKKKNRPDVLILVKKEDMSGFIRTSGHPIKLTSGPVAIADSFRQYGPSQSVLNFNWSIMFQK
jgi:hypothetical protein